MEALENIKNIKIYDTTFEHLTEVMDSYKRISYNFTNT